MGRIGALEIILIVLVIVLLFGARRIPELMRSLGSGVREFKKGARGELGDEETKAEKTGGQGDSSGEEPRS
jgi:sec-independent protein translocase protein TatA